MRPAPNSVDLTEISGETGSGRGQSHTVGVLLLTGVVVLLVGGSGVIFLSQMGTNTAPLFDANITINNETVGITHGGGESMDLDNLRVNLESVGNAERHQFDEGTVFGDDDERFEPSERIRFTHGLGPGQVTILVIHSPSNTVIERTETEISPPERE